MKPDINEGMYDEGIHAVVNDGSPDVKEKAQKPTAGAPRWWAKAKPHSL